ncbi:MAG TPA: lysophospholipid acyltransferase family protein [Thermoanaerobaculia bacterium]|jgi:KDO2-lipid IV(A) lauroyltransferase|nr:lysophospholipid acyltransferase family protein [Thermoanaerobaculia bacterium]
MPRRKKSRFRARLEPALLNAGLRLLTATLGRLPWPAAQRVGRSLGALGWILSRRDRRRTLDHLALAFPEMPEADRRRLGRDCFRHHGTTLGECLHLFHRDCAFVQSVAEVRGWEEIEQARAAGRALLLFTGHCGNWELLGAAVNCRGLGMAVVARPLDEPVQQRLLTGLRERFGTPSIARGSEGAARQLLATLRRGGALGMLIDQDTKIDGVWVPFFGRPAFTPVGAAKIALRQNTAVIPAFIERLADGRHAVTLHPPLDLPDDPTAATALMTAKIEEQIRRRPEQWVWMHRRWRRQPDGTVLR